MYLTRIPLNTRRRETMVALSSLNKLHGAIESCFPGGRQRRLWRIDTLNDLTWLMLLSETVPDLTRLQAQFGFLNRPGESKSCDALFSRIKEGTRWRFRLVANPTRSIPGFNGKRGKVVAESRLSGQEKWLMDRAESCGFSVTQDSFTVMRSEWKQFDKLKDKGHHVSILQVTYEGVLEVTDAKRFVETLSCGMGRDKAFGVGMMTVIRCA